MQSIRAFAQLVRPVNLLIIALTMLAMRLLVMGPILQWKLQLAPWKFGLSVAVMVLLAAAGNIINDYFDVRVDRINKPDRVVIDNGVKRRVAMAAHHACNALACLIGFYLAWDSGIWALAIVPVFMAASLWFYSFQFKKQPLIGNVVVALMVGVVPLWAGIFELLEQRLLTTGLVAAFGLDKLVWWVLLAYAAFAFLITLIREAQKDLEDLDGDRSLHFRTMPIAWGIPWTKRYILALYFVVFAGISWGTWLLVEMTDAPLWAVFATLFVLVLFPLISGLRNTWKGAEKRHFTKASRSSKWAMAGGIAMAGWILWFYLSLNA